jgi:hypothetical protein
MTRVFNILLIQLLSVAAFGQSTVQFQINTTSGNSNYTIEVLRFYISAITLSYSDGASTSNFDYYLVDMEDSSSFTLPLPAIDTSGAYKYISFTLGTDSLINVSGIMEGDLDPINGMYWAWNSGYINFKVEGSKNTDDSKQHFEYHLGGYLPPFETARIITLPLDNWNGELLIDFNLSGFLDALDMTTQHEVLIPGKEASVLSDQLSSQFKIHE